MCWRARVGAPGIGSTGPAAGGDRLGDPWAGPGRRHQPGVTGEAVVGELAVFGAQRLEVRFELGHGEPDLDVAQLEFEHQQIDLDQRGSGPTLQRTSSAPRST